MKLGKKLDHLKPVLTDFKLKQPNLTVSNPYKYNTIIWLFSLEFWLESVVGFIILYRPAQRCWSKQA